MNKTDLVMTTGVILGITGTWLNVLKEPFCFLLWLASNSIFVGAAWKEHNPWMVVVFITYLSMSLWGLLTW